MTLLLLLEIKSIYQERNEHDQQQAEARERETKHFESIAIGIEGAITKSQEHFDATMKESNKIAKLGQNTIAQVQESIKTTTGGDSFAWLLPLPAGGNQFTVLLVPAGRYPLHALRIRGFECTTLPSSAAHALADMQRGEQSVTIGDLPSFVVDTQFSIPDDADGLNCHAMFIANNGYWNQMIQLRLVNGAWKRANKIVLGKPGNPAGKVLVERAEDGYPKEPDGSIKWFMTLKP